MKQTKLSMEEFQRLLAAYGARPARWPADVRASAQALLASSADARALAEEESALDLYFEADPRTELPAGLQRALLEVPLRAPATRRRWPFGWWLPALGWAAAAAAGLWLGSSGLLAPEELEAADSAAQPAVLDSEEEDPVLELASGSALAWEDLP